MHNASYFYPEYTRNVKITFNKKLLGEEQYAISFGMLTLKIGPAKKNLNQPFIAQVSR